MEVRRLAIEAKSFDRSLKQGEGSFYLQLLSMAEVSCSQSR